MSKTFDFPENFNIDETQIPDAQPLEFNYIVSQLSDTVTKLCYFHLNNHEDAQDCYQNVFLKLYCHDIKNRPLIEIKKWLITVTINECKTLKKKLFYRNHLNLDDVVLAQEIPDDLGIRYTLKKLPDKYSSILYLYYYEGYKISEIAEILKMSQNTVKTRMSRAKQKLKEVLENDK